MLTSAQDPTADCAIDQTPPFSSRAKNSMRPSWLTAALRVRRLWFFKFCGGASPAPALGALATQIDPWESQATVTRPAESRAATMPPPPSIAGTYFRHGAQPVV